MGVEFENVYSLISLYVVSFSAEFEPTYRDAV